jgi:predicted metal-dependent enzyme (double-stranded beta helix superfamily)
MSTVVDPSSNPAPATLPLALAAFITSIERLLDQQPAESRILQEGGRLLHDLVSHDDWLPPAFERPGADNYRQYPLHRDPAGRFSVVSFVWGPGQGTPVHDHTVWGLIGMLRGAEESQGFRFIGPTEMVPSGAPQRLAPGQVQAVSPSIGDVHRVRNALDDQVSISIHIYGADIGSVSRSIYGEDGSRRPFVSGYSPIP